MTGKVYKVIAGCLVGIACAIGIVIYNTDPDLDNIQSDIQASHTQIAHISAAQFAKLNRDDTIVFDVRSQNEFDVSHIKGAYLVDPGIAPQQFIDLYGDLLKGKTAVFYCSVGRRSSSTLSRVEDSLTEHNVLKSYNLIGGLFGWHNEKQPMVQGQTETSSIHPYNAYWGRLIEDKTTISYTPNSTLETGLDTNHE